MSEVALSSVKKMVEEHGFAFVSEDVVSLRGMFEFALREGYGFTMEPEMKRRSAGDHPLIAKISTSQILSHYVAENRRLRAGTPDSNDPIRAAFEAILSQNFEAARRHLAAAQVDHFGQRPWGPDVPIRDALDRKIVFQDQNGMRYTIETMNASGAQLRVLMFAPTYIGPFDQILAIAPEAREARTLANGYVEERWRGRARELETTTRADGSIAIRFQKGAVSLLGVISVLLAGLLLIEGARYFRGPVAPDELHISKREAFTTRTFDPSSAPRDWADQCRREGRQLYAWRQDGGPWAFECIDGRIK